VALWRLPRPDFHRQADTDFQDTPLPSRPDDSLAIPKMASSIGFRNSVSFLPAIQAKRPLTLASVGLSPTERVSFRWTHIEPWCVSSTDRLSSFRNRRALFLAAP